jgi:hypothetical protein
MAPEGRFVAVGLNFMGTVDTLAPSMLYRLPARQDMTKRSASALLTLAAAIALAGCATATSGLPGSGAAAPVGSPASAAAAGPATAPGAKPAAPAAADPKSATDPKSAAAAAPGGAPARPPGAPQPFAEVVKDAKEQKGFFTIWTKDEKTWLEIAPAQLDRPFFFGGSRASGMGERFFLPGLTGREHIVVLRRAGNNVQLVAQNLRVRAPAGTPLAQAVQESYSDSLLASAPVASAPHPERKSILIDALALLGGDITGAQTALEAAYRLSYTLDRGNTTIERVRTGEEGTFITVRGHYSVAKLPPPPRPTPGAPPPNPATLPDPPRTVPDPRSLFLSFAYTLAPLPAQPMRPRVADQRIGHFTDAFFDLSDQSGRDSRTHYINRWRLEKRDPAAAVSEPKEPIRAVMDRNIPPKWRDAVRAGILEWNLAFERAGFRDAIRVEQQPDDADWSSLEGTRILAVRWFAMDGPGAVAVGPSQSDPRTGEILRAAAIIPENWVRLGRTRVAETLPRFPAPASLDELLGAQACTYAFGALERAEFGFELLAARGVLDPEGPEADRFIADSLKDVVMHEVGHALGLRHNFRGSTGIRLEQLRDAAFVRSRGISNSVMDYNGLNIPLEGEPASIYHQVTLGAYDYWAIEYAYREFDPAVERQELARIAARSERDPNLAYATDEDAGGFFGAGIDPLANQWDLTDDPLAFSQRQVKLARELWTRTQQRQLSPDDNLAVYRRNLQRGLAALQFTAPTVAKHIGGTYVSRSLAGAGQDLLVPVPAARQRQALDLLVREIFSSDSFRFDPRFMRRLGIEHLERVGGPQVITNPDFSLATSVLAIQRSVLDQLMAEALAARLADAETKVDDRRELVTYAEVQGQVADAVWSELRAGRAIDSLRRNLQREHVRRIAGGLVRPTPAVAADVRAVYRQVALKLEADMRRALASGRLDATASAHVAESLQTLAEALRAPLMKQAA